VLPESLGGSAEGEQGALGVVVCQMIHGLTARVQLISGQGQGQGGQEDLLGFAKGQHRLSHVLAGDTVPLRKQRNISADVTKGLSAEPVPATVK
jgi:hypothetical protein